MSPLQTELEMTPSIRFYPTYKVNLLGTRIRVTTQAPAHYERAPVTLCYVLRDVTSNEKKFEHPPEHRFVVEESSVNDRLIRGLFEWDRLEERAYRELFNAPEDEAVRTTVDKITSETPIAHLYLGHHPWSIAVGDSGIALRTRMYLFEPLGTVTKLEILERLES